MLFKNYHELVGNGRTPLLRQRRKDVLEMLTAAVDAVDPYLVVQQLFHGTNLRFESETIDLATFEHMYVVGFGKASVKMAQAVCDAISVTKGVVVTNDPSATVTSDSVTTIVGGHPLPTEESIHGAEKILEIVQESTENDCVIILISGGGSALFCSPRVPLEELQKTTDLLLRSGADITELNTIRKHLSIVKGGQLARYIKGVGISLVISDIVHDPISSIASGPTSPDPTTFSDAEAIFKRYHLWDKIPAMVRHVIEEGIAGHIPETPKVNDPVFRSMFHFIIANNNLACQAVMKKAKHLGYTASLLTTTLTGDARKIGAYLMKKIQQSLSPEKIVFITGGETTVTVHGTGNGGRNQELVLSCLEAIAGTKLVVASFATDGVDGNSPSAGALADGFSLSRAKTQHLSADDFVKENNSYEFFLRLGDVLSTGPTGTNVMDIQIVIR
jgi:glycerate 2-kinase